MNSSTKSSFPDKAFTISDKTLIGTFLIGIGLVLLLEALNGTKGPDFQNGLRESASAGFRVPLMNMITTLQLSFYSYIAIS